MQADREVTGGKPNALGPVNQSVCRGLAALTAISVVAMLLARYARYEELGFALIVVASTSFVLIALFAGGLGSWYGRLVVAALVFCWLGDVLGPSSFLSGVGAFLLAHLGFIGAFLSRGLAAKRCLATAGAVLLVSGSLFVWLYPHVPEEQHVLIFAYMFVISAMVVLAGGVRDGGALILIAAVTFYVSDIFVARWRYVSPGFVNGVICYPLYYAACVMFAFSVLGSRQNR